MWCVLHVLFIWGTALPSSCSIGSFLWTQKSREHHNTFLFYQWQVVVLCCKVRNLRCARRMVDNRRCKFSFHAATIRVSFVRTIGSSLLCVEAGCPRDHRGRLNGGGSIPPPIGHCPLTLPVVALPLCDAGMPVAFVLIEARTPACAARSS